MHGLPVRRADIIPTIKSVIAADTTSPRAATAADYVYGEMLAGQGIGLTELLNDWPEVFRWRTCCGAISAPGKLAGVTRSGSTT
jgi:hypothetical protein